MSLLLDIGYKYQYFHINQINLKKKLFARGAHGGDI